MGKETKSNGQKDVLDRFYTPKEIVEKCISQIELNQFDCIIEPSAGTGNFLDYLPNAFAYDISPEDDRIQKEDWFLLDKTIFSQYKNILVCGNPPFGQQNKIAIEFFNEASKFCNTIAFILPLSFKKKSIQDRLNLNFWLQKEIDLTNGYFFLKDKTKISVPCVFQIWQKKDTKREKIKSKTTTCLFDFVLKDQADFRIQRVGGNAGKASLDLNKAVSSNYFIKNKTSLTNEQFINLINSITFPEIEYTVGPKSLSKNELIKEIEEKYFNYKNN